ncbi:Aste57867_23417 [Aphanomyces stellatus]|uniref:Cilia- and flagella-associated protein 251 n=1 Tax=Aphanomyces stellatus TaxID=120398 RepID=A0A485LPA6_9STRA|nr:hypothetical protein As57867_023346 [Aphanomyces stellatus]VFU00063.1 Aste57867_23417 [Aphanomyces stellatus]
MDSPSANALGLSWSFGFNKDIVGGVHSLSDDHVHAIFYTAGHTGVIYNYANRTQRLLQGHCNTISCCAVSEDKRWIVTADRGQDSMLVVWDANTGNPIKTIFNPHADGVQCLDMSPDAMFIVTLSIANAKQDDAPEHAQEIKLWEWTVAREDALYAAAVTTEDVQTCVRFNTYDIRELMTNGAQRVIFWNWTHHTLQFYSPPLSQKDFKQTIGAFTQSLFVPDSSQAITATDDGDLILWDSSPIKTGAALVHTDKKAVKIVRMSGHDASKAVAINYLADMDGYLVMGCADGAVRFYDFDFRLVAWYEDLCAGPVVSVSFANMDMPASVDGFHVPEFVVATSHAFILGITPAIHDEYDVEKRRGTLLMQGINDEIHGLAAHPASAHIAVSCYSGAVQLWEYNTKRLVMMRNFDKLRPQCLTYSPSGKHLLVGFTNGTIKLVHAATLDDVTTFRHAKSPVVDVKIASDGTFIAAIDADNYLYLWRSKAMESAAGGDDAGVDAADLWAYIGRCKSHAKPITGFEFGMSPDQQPLLVTVGEDRMLVDYSLSRSGIMDGIVLNAPPQRIEQSATPTTCFWHPDLAGVHEDLVVVATDEYKFKQWNANNKTCRKTTLHPTYGGPLNRVVAIPLEKADAGRYCAYSTHEKVVGVLKLPLDGNPHKSMGLIAHPGRISNVAVTYDGRHLITAGGKDMIVNMWDINPRALDALEAQGGLGVEPYVSLLEGGGGGAFYSEIVDYFYFAQLRTQGEGSTAAREITHEIPLTEIPHVMRALGFYPTELEIQNMCSEIKYSKFTDTTKTVDVVNLADFVKLYVNHRPVFGIGKAQIEDAFDVINGRRGPATLKWTDLKTKLLTMGERMTDDELQSCLHALVGDDSDLFETTLQFSSLDFADKVLGFEDYNAFTTATEIG